MNKAQIRSHIGNDGQALENSNNRFSGAYTGLTEVLSGGKKKRGMLYDFNNTGLFLRSFDLSNDLSIFNTGMGSGLKKAFFDGYDNMFGLTKQNEEKLLQEVKAFIMVTSFNKLWQ